MGARILASSCNGCYYSGGPYTPRFEKEAVIWCAALLGVEVNRLEEILNNVSGHYQEFWMRKEAEGIV